MRSLTIISCFAVVIISISKSKAAQPVKRFSISSIVPSFLNPCYYEEKKTPSLPFESLIPEFPRLDVLSQKEDRCKDPLKHAVSGGVKAVVSRIIGPLMIPEVIKNAQIEMAGVIVEQSIEVGLKERNIAKAVSTPIGVQLRMIPFFGEKLDTFAESVLEKTINGILGTMCEQVDCCFD